MTKKPVKKIATKKATKKLPSSPQAMAQEVLRMITQRLGPDELIMPEDVNALMASLAGPLVCDHLSDAEADARDEAQQLAFDAMEAESAAEARKLAKRALKLDPDCVDALVTMTDLDARSTRETIEGLQKAVEAGERSLGAKFIKKNKGHFWMLIETRPYMRAMAQLAGVYRAEGFNKAAIEIYERMLALNPNDNQGVRDPLLGLYLALGGTYEAGKLLEAYKDDSMANFSWARVLERFLSHDLPGAAAALKIARKQNRFVELFLSGQKKLPGHMPDSYSPGSEEEAILCLDNLALAWGNFKPASFWLMEQLMKEAVPKKSPAAKLKIVSMDPGKKLQ